MLFTHLTGRAALTIRLIGLALVSWTVVRASHHPPGANGRGLVISVMFALCVVAWLAWLSRPVPDRGITPEVWVLAAAGGLLCGASPGSAASAFVFVAVVAAGVRAELSRAFIVVGVAILALALSVLFYDGSALGLLAYSLGFAAAALAGANAARRPGRPSRPSCCSPRVSARTRSSSAPRAYRSPRGSRGRSTMCSPTRSPH